VFGEKNILLFIYLPQEPGTVFLLASNERLKKQHYPDFLHYHRNEDEPIEFTTEPLKSISYECPPPQGLSEARRGKEVAALLVKPPRGRPVGGGGVHRSAKVVGASRRKSPL